MDKNRIDILTTAILRPEILEKTYASFSKHMFKEHEHWLYLNIDPLGEANPKDVLGVATMYFKLVHINMGDKPNCTEAWKWCWKHCEADIVLWLEDDWELLKEVDLDAIIKLMTDYPELGGIRLPKRDIKGNEFVIGHVGNNRYAMTYNEEMGLFEMPDKGKASYAITGNPCFYNGKLLRSLAPLLDPAHPHHPEKYLRYNAQASKIISQYRYGVYGKPNDTKYVIDIGYDWRAKQGFIKKSNGRGWKK